MLLFQGLFFLLFFLSLKLITTTLQNYLYADFVVPKMINVIKLTKLRFSLVVRLHCTYLLFKVVNGHANVRELNSGWPKLIAFISPLTFPFRLATCCNTVFSGDIFVSLTDWRLFFHFSLCHLIFFNHIYLKINKIK